MYLSLMGSKGALRPELAIAVRALEHNEPSHLDVIWNVDIFSARNVSARGSCGPCRNPYPLVPAYPSR